jgi:hypothetical protein
MYEENRESTRVSEKETIRERDKERVKKIFVVRERLIGRE